MATATAPVILYYNGELKNEGNNVVEYISGCTKLFKVSKSISFVDFCVKVEELCMVQLSDAYKIMTRLRLDELCVVSVDVSDDASLELAMNTHPKSCLFVVFYIVRTTSPGLLTNPPSTLAMPREINTQTDASSISNGDGVNGRFDIQVDRAQTQMIPQLACEPADDLTDGMTRDHTDCQLDYTSMDGVVAGFDNAPCGISDLPDPLDNDDEKVESNSSHDWDFTKEFTTDKLFNGRKELLDWVRKVGMSLGIVVVIKGSKASVTAKYPHTWLHCDRSGKYRDKSGKKRYCDKINKSKGESNINKRLRSNKCGCPFELRAGRKGNSGDLWELKVYCGRHNHQPADLEGHAYAGRLTEEEEKLVVEMTKNDWRPREILEILKERRPENCSNINTIYSVKKKLGITKKIRKKQSLKNCDSQLHRGEEDGEHTEDVRREKDNEHIEDVRRDGDGEHIEDVMYTNPGGGVDF
ncbi:hypothetical protein GIB67_018599 [Kingdonia uniflora]|uniref:Uncharacterized protein n=1 Tax=Kingdonia uniflora TaxID=39325 RepID=A0A7J7L8J2_9MAGN|nr:hypothetical protein GIB67_018599 [Kingdonia uniflora]